MRFPTYPPDILSRADALLSEKYGTDNPIDPLLVEIACEAMMAQREVDAETSELFIIRGNSIHPDIAFKDLSENARMIAHTTGQHIANAIRNPALPEPTPSDPPQPAQPHTQQQ